MTKWFACNKLSINSSRCETISFGNGTPPEMKVDNININDKHHCKYLGVHLDPQFNFREHIISVAKNEQVSPSNVQSQANVTKNVQFFITPMLKLSSVMV